MTKLEYIKQLEVLLKDKVSDDVMFDTIKDCITEFEQGAENGKTEEQIISEMETPKIRAAKASCENPNISTQKANTNTTSYEEYSSKDIVNKKANYTKTNFSGSKTNIVLKLLMGIFLAIFFTPIFLSFLGISLVFVISSIIGLISIPVFGIILPNPLIVLVVLSLLVIIFFNIGVFCLTLMLTIKFIKYFFTNENIRIIYIEKDRTKDLEGSEVNKNA